MTAIGDSTSTYSAIPATKCCARCKQQLSALHFHKNLRSTDGLQGFCIACAKQTSTKHDEERASKTRAFRSYATESLQKPCSVCLVDKPMNSDHWTKSGRGLGGFNSKCKSCERQAREAKKNPALIAKQADALALRQTGMKRCPQCGTAKSTDCFMRRKIGGYYSYCLECCKEQSNAKRLADVEGDRAKKLRSWKKRLAENGDAMREVRNGWRRVKRKTDPVYAMESRVRALLLTAFKRKGFTKRSTTYRIVGCSWPDLADHIQRQFLRGMSWSNREKWHLDHIVPLATAKTETDVVALNHFTNLRPIWAKDNLSKGAQITHLI